MIDYNKLTPEQLQDMRDKAFYLLKKHTSVTWLQEAVRLYQILLDEMVRLLNKPEFASEHEEAMYRRFLKGQIPNEEGLDLLKKTPHKESAYTKLGVSIGLESVFGTPASDWLHTYTLPFMVELGIRGNDSDFQLWDKEFGKWQINGQMRQLMAFTTTGFAFYSEKYEGNRVHRWSWELIFDLTEWYGSFINFPAPLKLCPPPNKDATVRVWSNEEIPITGIYEPVYVDGRTTGCPNYYLAGQTALEYPLENSAELMTVGWQLLWEDKRYLDGTIPQEEQTYLHLPEAATPPVRLSDTPNSVCPKAGTQQTPAKKSS